MALDNGDVDGGQPPTLEATGMPARLVWQADPIELALEASTEMRKLDGASTNNKYLADGLPDAFCYLIGKTLLLMQLRFSDWVLRRVEKVAFERDRSVSRKITIEFNIPENAPQFLGLKDEKYWLIPLSIMRRRTLVNLDLRDEDGRSVSLPGLRLTQQLDESVLLAAATAADIPSLGQGTPMRRFIQTVIAGTDKRVSDAVKAFEAEDTHRPAYLEDAAKSALFSAMVHRLKSNFALYLFLPVEMGRHRILRMSFDEPTEWKPRRAVLKGSESGGFDYIPNLPLRPFDMTHLKSALGFTPTRIRFQVPSAENAASYHFEVTAPPGLRIVESSLLAGRPNDPDRHVSTDHVEGHSPTMGLHAVEVPYGSLCRVQVDVRVPTHGWLGTALVTCWLIFFVLFSVYRHKAELQDWEPEQVTNVIALLIAVVAGGAALIAQREFSGVAARLVSRMRVLGVVALALPIVVAGLLAYEATSDLARQTRIETVAITAATVIAFLIALIFLASWGRAFRDGRRSGVPSPWDMTRDMTRDMKRDMKRDVKRRTYSNFHKAREDLGFDTPAVGVRSAEGWHKRYEWNDDKLRAAIESLDPQNDRPGSYHGVACHPLLTTCLRSGRCPSALLGEAAEAGPARTQ